MTFWINEELDLINVVIEPSRPGVLTLLSNSLDTLLPYLGMCAERPFRPIGGGFRFGAHVPMAEIRERHPRLLASEHSESLRSDVSAEPIMFRWIGRRRVDDIDLHEPEGFQAIDGDEWYLVESGFVWPDDPTVIANALAADGLEDVALIPSYREHPALKLECTFAGEIESYVPVSDDDNEGMDEPPNFRDLFGGGA